jgi:hypothetical protein
VKYGDIQGNQETGTGIRKGISLRQKESDSNSDSSYDSDTSHLASTGDRREKYRDSRLNNKDSDRDRSHKLSKHYIVSQNNVERRSKLSLLDAGRRGDLIDDSHYPSYSSSYRPTVEEDRSKVTVLIYIYVYMYMYIYIYIYIYICIYICVYIYIYVYMYIYMYICYFLFVDWV